MGSKMCLHSPTCRILNQNDMMNQQLQYKQSKKPNGAKKTKTNAEETPEPTSQHQTWKVLLLKYHNLKVLKLNSM